MEELVKKLDKVIKDAQNKIAENQKWKKDYDRYASELLLNKEKKIKLSKKIEESENLKYYIKIGDIINAKTYLKLSVRYLGQIVAYLKVKDDAVYISTVGKNGKRTIDESNNEDFGCHKELKLKDAKWNSQEAIKFRKYFQERETIKEHNQEHRVESMIISKMLKDNKKVVPITYLGFPMPMRTIIKCSKHKNGCNIINSGNGYIDILAKTKEDNEIVVMEVKDKLGDNGETIENILQQATGYAVFLSELLHSDFGQKWYEIFGFSGLVPKKLRIKVCSVLPKSEKSKCTDYKGITRNCGNDIFEYHWLYFEENGKEITNIDSSF